MSSEKHVLGWYLHNALKSDHADLLLNTVDRYIPCMRGGEVKPEQPRSAFRLSATNEMPKRPSRTRMLTATKPYAEKPEHGMSFIETNAMHVASALGLDTLEVDLLLLILRGNRSSTRHPILRFINDAWRHTDEVSLLGATLLNVAVEEVRSRLEPQAKLVVSGLLDIDRNCSPFTNFVNAIKLQPRVLRLMQSSYADPAACAQALLGVRAETTLRWADFRHLHETAEVAVKVLRRAASNGEAGVHVLLRGPAGAGKTELAKVLAARAGLSLFAAGEAREGVELDQAEPSRSERFAALRMTCTLLGRVRSAAVLLDEAEDVMDSPRSFGTRRESFSKVFLHRTLEALQVPVIWTCNDLSLMDAATLRRMTVVIDMPVPDTAVRTQIWRRVLSRERVRLAVDAPERLAERWDASAGLAAGAARAARLSGGGVAALERALGGVMGAMGQRETPHVRQAAFDADLVNCGEDLHRLYNRLAQPETSRAWSLCLSGPPGTGKSEFARYLARRLALPVLQKRASDLLSMFVGGSEKAIARAFREARERKALLLIDEAEALLFDRGSGARSWELSQVNEMLTWMEDHPLPFVCTTNLSERMDRAVPRRFTLKLHFGTLNAAQAVLAFRRLLAAEPPDALPDGLTPGDFAVVRKKADLFAERDPHVLLAWLWEEAAAKGGARSDIGFRIPPRKPDLQIAAKPRRFPHAV